MLHPVNGIDHVFLLINDLDAGVAAYSALGFVVSPRGLHSASKGTANHTIMFPDDYVELLGILQSIPANAGRRALLDSAGEGLLAIACRIDDAELAAAALDGLGIATEGLGSFQRPVTLPDGNTGTAAFTTVAFAPEEIPLGQMFMCQHRSRDTVWIPELLEHPNSACGIDGIIACSDNTAADATRFARLFAQGRVRETTDGNHVATGLNSAPIRVVKPEALARLYPGIVPEQAPGGAFAALRIKVRSLETAQGICAAAGITSSTTEDGFAVAPSFTCGTILEFVPA